MALKIRPVTQADAETLGPICYEAFHKISTAHNFPPDFPSAAAGIGFMKMATAHPEVYGVVAEVDGRVAGSNFLWEQSDIAGIGPITVDPNAQNAHVGRALMSAVLDRVAEKGRPGVRLVQAAFHNRSLSLYTKLGFDPREPLSMVQGPAVNRKLPGYTVRAVKPDDLEACNEVCRRVHGHDRVGEVRDAIAHGVGQLVEHDGRVTGYTTTVGFFGHTVGETNSDVKALIAATPAIAGPGMLVPTRNADLLRWCLNNGLRVIQPMTLMSKGLYNEPQGAFMPSIIF
jgi:predicted N-acetyltransferase YhbS